MDKFTSLLVVAFLAVILGSTGVLADSPVGCEYYNSTLLECHNQGSIEPYNYFGTNAVWMTSNNSNRHWADYEMGLAMYRNGNWNFIPGEFAPEDLTMQSDNQTYWLNHWSYQQSWGPHRVNVTYTQYQELYDDLVTLQLTIIKESPNTIQGTAYFYRKLFDIDIQDDGEVDLLSLFINDSGDEYATGHYLNSTFEYENVQALNLADNTTTTGIKFVFEIPQTIHVIQSDTTNYDVYILEEIGSLSQDVHYENTHQWIDATPCYLNCPFSCFVRCANNLSATIYLDQAYCGSGGTYDWKAYWYNDGLGCGLRGCTAGVGCYLEWQSYDTAYWDIIPPKFDYEKGVNCNAAECKKLGPVIKNLWYNRKILGVKPKSQFIRNWFGDGTTGVSSFFFVSSVSQCHEQNITLESPVKLFNATVGENIDFNCTRSVYWTDYLALFINDTMYYNESSQGFDNLTHTWSANETGVYEWDCQSMTYGNNTDMWSWNGNWTFNISEALAISSKKFIYFWIDRSFSF